MRKGRFTVAAVLLAWCLAVAVAWARSYGTPIVFRFGPAGLGTTVLTVADGAIFLQGPYDSRGFLIAAAPFWRIELGSVLALVFVAVRGMIDRLAKPAGVIGLVAGSHFFGCFSNNVFAFIPLLALDAVLVVVLLLWIAEEVSWFVKLFPPRRREARGFQVVLPDGKRREATNGTRSADTRAGG